MIISVIYPIWLLKWLKVKNNKQKTIKIKEKTNDKL